MAKREKLIKWGTDWGYVDDWKPKQVVKRMVFTVAYLLYGYLGLRMAASQDPEINWPIKLVGFFAWWCIPFWVKEHSKKQQGYSE